MDSLGSTWFHLVSLGLGGKGRGIGRGIGRGRGREKEREGDRERDMESERDRERERGIEEWREREKEGVSVESLLFTCGGSPFYVWRILFTYARPCLSVGSPF